MLILISAVVFILIKKSGGVGRYLAIILINTLAFKTKALPLKFYALKEF